jgi:uncharacterized protein (DUF433 family)
MTAAVDIGTLIVETPGFLGGRPRIAGHRIGVKHIAVLSQLGRSPEAIIEHDYPQLSLAEVHAALAYYHANRQAIDDDLEADKRAFEAEAPPAGEGGPAQP